MGAVNQHAYRQPFHKHVRELRKSILYSVLAVLAASAIGYAIYKPLFAILIRPYSDKLYYTSPTGALNAIFEVAFLFGVVTALPFVTYQIYRFIKPAFAKPIHYFAVKLIILSAVLAISGVSFGYFVCLPATLHFLTSVGPADITAIIDVSSYINFVFNYLLIMAIVFQLPLVLLIINKAKPLKLRKLMAYQKYVVAFGFIVAVLIAPAANPINLFLLAAPIIGLYQVAIIMIWLSNRKTAFLDFETVEVRPTISNTSITLAKDKEGAKDVSENKTNSSDLVRTTRHEIFKDIIPR